MTSIVFIFFFTMLFIVFGIQAAVRLRGRQKLRIGAYRNSPESRLLRLND